MREIITNYEDLMEMLDSLFREPTGFWDDFYSEREKRVPFFANVPDENLVSYFDRNLVRPGRVLELGCGPGRNAIYCAKQGCKVDAIDLSQESLDWAKERGSEENVEINFKKENIFKLEVEPDSYDIVYDSGCLHHIPPHRRISYINLVEKALKPGGYFGLTCFLPGGELGGANITDLEVYKQQSLKGGLGYSEDMLRSIFKDFKAIEIRNMKEVTQPNVFGVVGLLTALFQK
jgi:SAM-dependent methyltransferase